jgi:TrmH family RNA methyltransferase
MLSKNEIKYIQSLSAKKARQTAGVFLAEGPKLVAEALAQCPQRVQHIYALPQWIDTETQPLPANTALTLVQPFELAKISQLQTPQEVLALISLRATEAAAPSPNQWCLLLNDVQDPGNLGNILRTADWFGWQEVFCTPGTVDGFNPKVVQASMGAILRVALHYAPADRLLQSYEGPVYGSFVDGLPITAGLSLAPGVLIIGNEGNGISPLLMPFITQKISIAKQGGGESLNAAMAAGIFMAMLTK